jgi:hypothetical protein
VFSSAEEIETTDESIQVWLQLNEGDPEFQLLTREEIVTIKLFLLVISNAYSIKFSIFL